MSAIATEAAAPAKQESFDFLHIDTKPIIERIGKVIPRALYWFGAMPSEETAKNWHSSTKDEERYCWIGKCRHFQNIGIPGIEFVAFDYRKGHPSFENAIPGHVAMIDDESVKSILHNINRRILREHILEATGPEEKDRASKRGGNIICVDSPTYEPNARADTPLAAYLYIKRIKNEYDRPQSMEGFFNSPPRSIME